jgi:2-polyprenyl-6-hydroxyphenyl methylase/3-demethylubiquinone-9 3-methyltransferase
LLAEAMAREGASVVGLDLAADLLSVARLHALEAGIEVDYQLASAEQHAAEHAGRYDVVTCMEMLEHVPDPAAVVTALAALARPGGEVFVSTLNRTPTAYLKAILGAEYLLRLLPTGTHTYEKFIRPSELAGWARSSGLTLVDVTGLDYDPFTRGTKLVADARVNYLMHYRKPTAAPGAG